MKEQDEYERFVANREYQKRFLMLKGIKLENDLSEPVELEPESDKELLIRFTTEAEGNVDTLIRKLMDHARQCGHSSIYLGSLLRMEDELLNKIAKLSKK